MAKAQQKPKGKSGERNSNRRNGKSWKRDSPAQSGSPKFTKEGKVLRGKGKPTGKSILGYRRERVVKWAQESGQTLEAYVLNMKLARAEKLARRKEASWPGVVQRREAAGFKAI